MPSVQQSGKLRAHGPKSVGRRSVRGSRLPSVDESVLDNAVWHSLSDAHRSRAQRVGTAARYDPDVSVFGAIGDDGDAGWRDLATLVGPGGHAVLFRADLPQPPAGWTQLGGGRGHQMVLRELAPVDVPDARLLGTEDAGEMLALVELTKPGPFAARTVELGGYVGVFSGGQLVAMAGERLAPPGYREISAVCTHPDFRGRGLAAGLTALVAQRILERGEQPFLHHAVENEPARRVYEALGFAFHQEVSFAAHGAS
jgi:ribosomal protein S18 acetylase RimI-like enzyme